MKRLWRQAVSAVLCLVFLAGIIPAMTVDAGAISRADATAALPYSGDRAGIAMSAEQARAYASAVEKLRSEERSGYMQSFVSLFDGGSGIPILWYACASEGVFMEPDVFVHGGKHLGVIRHALYEWDGTKAVESAQTRENGSNLMSIDVWPEGIEIRLRNGNSDEDGGGSFYYDQVFPYSSGRISTSSNGGGSHSGSNPHDCEDIGSGDGTWAESAKAVMALRAYAEAVDVQTPAGTKVTLNLNGGTGPAEVWADENGSVPVPKTPVLAGYSFGGWYTDTAMENPWNFNDTTDSEMTLHARWIPVSSSAKTAHKSDQLVYVNTWSMKLQGYALPADSNGGDVTYVKLRDVAAVLNGTSAQFNVEWKNGVSYVSSGTPYIRSGTELQEISGASGAYQWNSFPVLFDGVMLPLEGIIITDSAGGGHTMFKLRDLGAALNFKVDWDADQGIIISTE